MKKTYKILSVLMVALFIMSCAQVVNAISLTPDTSGSGASLLMGIGGKILGIVTTVGMVLAVVVVAILGVKYMMGSTEEKAEYKKSMMPYVVGAILVFAASGIGNMVYNFAVNVASDAGAGVSAEP